MLEITRAEVDEETDDESNEAAYAELVEYLRVAAQLAYEELSDYAIRWATRLPKTPTRCTEAL